MSKKNARFALWNPDTTSERVAEWICNEHKLDITKIDLDLKPSDVHWQSDLAGLSYPLIVVRDRVAYLALMTFDESVMVADGKILDHEEIGITTDMMLAGGGIEKPGVYPISLEIKERLKSWLEEGHSL